MEYRPRCRQRKDLTLFGGLAELWLLCGMCTVPRKREDQVGHESLHILLWNDQELHRTIIGRQQLDVHALLGGRTKWQQACHRNGSDVVHSDGVDGSVVHG